MEREQYRQAILNSYKNKLQDLEDMSTTQYKQHIRELSQRQLMDSKMVSNKQFRDTMDTYLYTQDNRPDENEIKRSLEKLEHKMRSAEKRSCDIKERIIKKAKEFSEKVPDIQQRYFKMQNKIEESKQVEFIKLNRKNNTSYKRKEKNINQLKSKHHMNLSMRFERSHSIKYYRDQTYDDWKSKLEAKQMSDLKKLQEKRNKMSKKAEILREVNKLRFGDMESNLMREIYKIKHRKERLLDREANNRERVNRLSVEKQKAVENQMEINRIVQQQAQFIGIM
jgi:hypothetical protein